MSIDGLFWGQSWVHVERIKHTGESRLTGDVAHGAVEPFPSACHVPESLCHSPSYRKCCGDHMRLAGLPKRHPMLHFHRSVTSGQTRRLLLQLHLQARYHCAPTSTPSTTTHSFRDMVIAIFPCFLLDQLRVVKGHPKGSPCPQGLSRRFHTCLHAGSMGRTTGLHCIYCIDQKTSVHHFSDLGPWIIAAPDHTEECVQFCANGTGR